MLPNIQPGNGDTAMRKASLYLIGAAATVALAVQAMTPVSPSDAARKGPASKYLPRITINVSNTAMTASHKNITFGDYIVVVRNYGSQPKGVRMTGLDSAGSPFVRYSRFLRTGKADKFRWYFAKGQTVTIRDVVSCTLNKRGHVVAATAGSQQCEITGHPKPAPNDSSSRRL